MDWIDYLISLAEGNCDFAFIADEINRLYGMDIDADYVKYCVGKSKPNQLERVNSGTEKILVLSDLHCPFHREDKIIEIVMQHRDSLSAIIFGGDTIDCESISVFPKECRRPLIQEMIVTYKLLKRIDKLTPGVKKYLIWGNHEYRYVKYLAEHGNELNPFHSDNILQEMISGFTYHDRPNKRRTAYPPLSDNFEVVDKWYMQYNDLIVAHPKNFSKVHLRTAVNTLSHFLKKGLRIGCLIIGHTHKWGFTTDFGALIGENGCLCKEMEYADSGNINYTPQEYGYSVIIQRDGKTDVSRSRIQWVSVEDGDETWHQVEDQS